MIYDVLSNSAQYANLNADIVKALEAAGIRDQVKVMVGGAPVTQEFCDRIGADCYTEDGNTAAVRAVELLGA